MGRLRDWFTGPTAFVAQRPSQGQDGASPDFTRQPTTGFQLDGTFGGLQAEDSLLELVSGFSDDWIDRAAALRVPAVLRARNLIASTSATLTCQLYNRKTRELDDRRWLGEQPSKLVEQTVTYALTFEDLLFHGRSYWEPTEWLSGFPVQADRLHYPAVSQQPLTGIPQRIINDDNQYEPEAPVYINGLFNPYVIRFLSPNPPVLKYAARAIRTYLALDEAARRMAREPIPLGYFSDAEGAPEIGDDEVQDALDSWERARRARAWAYVPPDLTLNQLTAPTAEQMQLVESRNMAALEIARVMGIDPDYLGIPASSRTYVNAESRRLDLVDFTLVPYLSAIENRLSMPDVTPRGLVARFAVDEFSRGDFASRMAAYGAAKSSGVYDTNELRRREYLPDAPDPVTPAPLREASADGQADIRDTSVSGGPSDKADQRDDRSVGAAG